MRLNKDFMKGGFRVNWNTYYKGQHEREFGYYGGQDEREQGY